MVCGISKELTTEHYHNARSIADRCTVISRKWAELQNKLDDLRETLSLYHDLMSVFSEMEDCLTDMGHIEVRGLDHLTFALCMEQLQQFLQELKSFSTQNGPFAWILIHFPGADNEFFHMVSSTQKYFFTQNWPFA